MKGFNPHIQTSQRFGEEAPIIRDMDYQFIRGKYDGHLVSDVVIEDPDYIQEQIDDFDSQFTDEVLDLL